VLRRAQGRLADVEETIARSVHEYPALIRFRCALAHLYGELGRRREARTVFGNLVSRDLSEEYVDAEWLFNMSLLPDVCAVLGDKEAAAELYALLVPYERLYGHAPVEVCFGSIARGLGVLATTSGHVAFWVKRGMATAPEEWRRGPPEPQHSQASEPATFDNDPMSGQRVDRDRPGAHRDRRDNGGADDRGSDRIGDLPGGGADDRDGDAADLILGGAGIPDT
jgi:hypothetical protein